MDVVLKILQVEGITVPTDSCSLIIPRYDKRKYDDDDDDCADMEANFTSIMKEEAKRLVVMISFPLIQILVKCYLCLESLLETVFTKS